MSMLDFVVIGFGSFVATTAIGCRFFWPPVAIKDSGGTRQKAPPKRGQVL
jgi:hypothetical protein